MPQHDALLAAIFAAPDDDLPRLVYADWLDENGDPDRAAFIRLQCQLPDDDCEARCEALFTANREAWSAGFPSNWLLSASSFSRGFVSFLNLDSDDLGTEQLATLCTQHPFDEVFLRRVDSFDPVALASWSHLPRVRKVSFSTGDDNDHAALRALLAAPGLTALRELNLGLCHLPAADAALIADNPRFRTLRSLDVGYNPWDDDALDRIFRSPHLAALTAFDLSMTDVTASGLDQLTTAPFFRGLHSIGLNGLSNNAGGYTPGAVLAVVGQLPFDRLTELTVSSNHLGDRVIQALADSRLTKLDLSNNHITPDGAAAFFRSPACAELTALNLNGNPIGPSVQKLANRTESRLKTLDLTNCGLSAADVEQLANSGVCAGLRELHLRAQPIGDAAAFALARSPTLGRLRQLRLASCDIGDEGARALAGMPFARRMGALGLSYNPISEDVCREIQRKLGYDPTSY